MCVFSLEAKKPPMAYFLSEKYFIRTYMKPLTVWYSALLIPFCSIKLFIQLFLLLEEMK